MSGHASEIVSGTNRFDMRPLGEEIRPADTVSAVAWSRASKYRNTSKPPEVLSDGRFDMCPSYVACLELQNENLPTLSGRDR